jgi:hypothetical protein
MPLTNRVLLRLHVEAVWGVRLPAIRAHYNDVELLADGRQPGWKLYVAELAGGARIHIWRSWRLVEAAEHAPLLTRAYDALALPPDQPTASGISREVALRRTAARKLTVTAARQVARILTEADRPLVERFLPDSVEYYFHLDRRPLIGVVVQGRLLSLAHSSRRTDKACELGIDTLPEARRQGYALAAITLWAHTVARESLVPLYSAFADNAASLALAHAAGYRAFARGVSVE